MHELIFLPLDIPFGEDFERALIPKINQIALKIESGLLTVFGGRIQTNIKIRATKSTKPQDKRFPYLSIAAVVQLREGFRRGADIEIIWVKTDAEKVAIKVETASQLSSLLHGTFWGISGLFVLIYFILAWNAERKSESEHLIGAGIFLFLGMFFGAIVCGILKLFLGSRMAEQESVKLTEEIRKWIETKYKSIETS